MSRHRVRPDGLPFRVYERRGVRLYSVGHKGTGGRWTFRLTCPIDDVAKVAELRRDAITKAIQLSLGAPAQDTFGALIDAWLSRQVKLPVGTEGKRAASTLSENRREAENLRRAM